MDAAHRARKEGYAPMKLKELLQGLTVLNATADLEMDITNVSYDSRTTRPGDLFVAGLRR